MAAKTRNGQAANDLFCFTCTDTYFLALAMCLVLALRVFLSLVVCFKQKIEMGTAFKNFHCN